MLQIISVGTLDHLAVAVSKVTELSKLGKYLTYLEDRQLNGEMQVAQQVNSGTPIPK